MASLETLEERPKDLGPVQEKEELKGEEKEEGKGAAEKEERGGEQDEGEGLKEPERDSSVENGGLEETGEKSKEQGGGKKVSRETKKRKPTKEAKEPVTPTIERPARERKIVKRYSASSPGRGSASKALLIEKGRGTQLKDIPNVAFKLSKRKADDNLQMLHTVLFGKKTTAHKLKRNIGQFSGYMWVENEQEKQRTRIKDKLDKFFKEKLLDFCDVLDIHINKANVRKEELSAKLLEFLESPHATTDVLLADKEQRGKKRQRKTSTSQNVKSGESSMEMSSKKRKRQNDEKSGRTSIEEDHDDEDEPSDTKNFSHDGNDSMPKEESEKEKGDSEEAEDQRVEQKSSHKSVSKKNFKGSSGAITEEKATPMKKDIQEKKATKKASGSTSKKGTVDGDGRSSKAKGSGANKQKVEKKSQKSGKESSKPPAKASAAKEGKGKKGKKARNEPTREEMHAVIIEILKKVDFNTATLSDILKQLGAHFGMDLMERKVEVKAIITDVINSMSDDEEEEAEENSESEDEAGKGYENSDSEDDASKGNDYSESEDDGGKGNDNSESEDDAGNGNGTDSDGDA